MIIKYEGPQLPTKDGNPFEVVFFGYIGASDKKYYVIFFDPYINDIVRFYLNNQESIVYNNIKVEIRANSHTPVFVTALNDHYLYWIKPTIDSSLYNGYEAYGKNGEYRYDYDYSGTQRCLIVTKERLSAVHE